MTSIGPELVAESAATILYAVVATVLTGVGTVVEYSSLQHFGAGETVIALWLAAFGAVMLYAGAYGLGYQKVLARSV